MKIQHCYPMLYCICHRSETVGVHFFMVIADILLHRYMSQEAIQPHQQTAVLAVTKPVIALDFHTSVQRHTDGFRMGNSSCPSAKPADTHTSVSLRRKYSLFIFSLCREKYVKPSFTDAFSRVLIIAEIKGLFFPVILSQLQKLLYFLSSKHMLCYEPVTATHQVLKDVQS